MYIIKITGRAHSSHYTRVRIPPQDASTVLAGWVATPLRRLLLRLLLLARWRRLRALIQLLLLLLLLVYLLLLLLLLVGHIVCRLPLLLVGWIAGCLPLLSSQEISQNGWERRAEGLLLIEAERGVLLLRLLPDDWRTHRMLLIGVHSPNGCWLLLLLLQGRSCLLAVGRVRREGRRKVLNPHRGIAITAGCLLARVRCRRLLRPT